MEFNILPNKGLKKISFGISHLEVRKVFKQQPESFSRGDYPDFPYDYYEAEGAFFYYDADGHLEAIEFVRPARAQLSGVDLLSLRLDEAITTLSSLDTDVQKDADGAIAYGIGVGLYAPLASDDAAASIESVIAFRPDITMKIKSKCSAYKPAA